MTKAYVYKSGAYVEIDKVLQGLTITERIDETLDAGTIVTHSNIDFEIYDSIKIEIDSFVKYFLVSDISIEKKPNTNIPLKKIISLIEPTKYLEKVVVNAASFTNKSLSLLEQMKRLLINCEVLITPNNPRFTLSLDLQTLLYFQQGEDFFFEKRTLRECLDEMLSVVNARCEVLEINNMNAIVITYYTLNKVGTSSTFTNKLKEEKVQNIEYLGSDIETSVVNAFTGDRDAIYHPSPNGYTTFKTEEATLTSSNAMISTAFPIEEIIEFIVKMNVDITYVLPSGGGMEDTTNFTLDFNIIRNVLVAEAWNLLPTASLTELAYMKTSNFVKGNTMSYTRGATDISSGTTKLFFGATSTFKVATVSAFLNTDNYAYVLGVLNALHPSEPREINRDDISHISTTNLDYNSAVFRIEYVPYIDAHAKVGKGNYNKVKSTIISSQTDKTVDLNRLGVVLKNNINRFGNEEIFIDDVVNNHDGALQTGDIVNTNYVITEKTISAYDDFLKCRYVLSKNFASINQKIGIDRKRQIYNIPLENFKADTLVKIKVNFSQTSKVITSFSELLKNALYTLQPLKANEPLNNAIVELAIGNTLELERLSALTEQDKNDARAYGYLTNLYELALADYQIANSCLFTFNFEDNYSAGMSAVGYSIGGIKQVPNRYVNEDGEYFQIHARLFNDTNAVNRPTSYADVKLLPKTLEEHYIGTYDDPVVFPISECFRKTKDRYEHHSFTFQVEFDSEDNDIIITDKFAELNSLINYDKSALKYYSSTSLTYSKDSKKGLGLDNVLTASDFTFTSTSSVAMIEVAANKGKLSWAICDSNDNILIAVNNRNKVYSKVYLEAKYE